MTPMMTLANLRMIAVVGACLLITGCGDDEFVETQKPIERGIVTSALECADTYSIEIAKCTNAIREAIAEHEKTAPKYNRLHKCEAAEGPQRCERAGQKDFSRRLQAFLIGVTDPLRAIPLYAPTDTKPGYVRVDGTAILLDQDDIKFTEQAVALAEQNSELPKKKGAGGF